jgi:hypothetical protein
MVTNSGLALAGPQIAGNRDPDRSLAATQARLE